MSYTVRNTFEKSAVEMRKVYTDTLIDMARKNDKICILDADLVGSSGVKAFFKEFPERAIDCGIQEANMIGVAAGMSSVGFVPFVHSFGPFASRRVADQIFLSCAYAKLNVKILGSDPGVTAAYNGGTHMPFEDVALYRTIPGAVIVDVGTTRVPSTVTKSGWKLKGDVDFEHVAPKCSYITPVPGGVGPMTIVSLMKNTLLAAKKVIY